MVEPDISQLGVQLAEVIARNAASAVASKVRAITARRADQEAVNELTELVNDLIADRNELIGIATAFEQEMIAQRISERDIQYITEELLPVIERLSQFSRNSEQTQDAINALRGLVTPETLTIMQLVGFNFRRAVGEPLTNVVERLILSRVPAPNATIELQELQLKSQIELYQTLRDPEARRYLGFAPASETTE